MSRHNPTRRRLIESLVASAVCGALAPPATSAAAVALLVDDALSAYGFPAPHPFGRDRQAVFVAAIEDLLPQVSRLASRIATRAELERFHDPAYVERVASAAAQGLDFLDRGDTPVFPAIYTAAACVVGSALAGLDAIMTGSARYTFQPIGGLHHAARAAASGFCVFNDIGVVIETLRAVHGVARIAYIDIDVHHGDGVFYAFEDDPELVFADVHQDGATLFPGSGRADETGRGAARGTKLNVALPPRAGDAEFLAVWPAIEAHLERYAPAFFILQAGADGLAGDPLAQLEYSAAVHHHVTTRVQALAERHAAGRLMVFGGGGYGRKNLAQAWRAVLIALLART